MGDVIQLRPRAPRRDRKQPRRALGSAADGLVAAIGMGPQVGNLRSVELRSVKSRLFPFRFDLVGSMSSVTFSVDVATAEVLHATLCQLLEGVKEGR